MTHGSLFSGIGGFDLAAEWMGWENVFHCEWNEFGQKVLNYYWPNAKSYTDITKTDFSIHRGSIDILTGGFPCQPYSMAGKRKGKEDNRHLWPEMLRAIKEIQPSWVVGENVHGLINWSGGLVFHEVQTDLEAAGYEVFPYVLPACAVNAPHRRDRIWFIAHRNIEQREWEERGFQSESFDGSKKITPNPNDTGSATYRSRNNGSEQEKISKRENPFVEHNGLSNTGIITNPNEHTEGSSGKSRSIDSSGSDNYDESEKRRTKTEQHIGCNKVQSNVTDTNSNGQHRGNSEYEVNTGEGREYAQHDIEQICNTSDTIGIGLEWSIQTGEHEGQRQQISQRGKISEYLHESRAAVRFENFPTQSPLCGRNDGVSSELVGITIPKHRTESIKAYGNAIVPQVAYQIFKTIAEYEKNNQIITNGNYPTPIQNIR